MEAVIMTHKGAGAPHLKALERWNPELRVRVAKWAGFRDPAARAMAWRNADRRIREWWTIYRRSVTAERVCFLEYDVLVNADLLTLAGAADLIGRKVEPRGSDWPFWREARFLPACVRPHATGLAPLACLVIRREVLDELIKPWWDALFRRDIFCELRLPSVAAACGFTVGDTPLLEGCRWHEMGHPGERPGIWHAVKRGGV